MRYSDIEPMCRPDRRALRPGQTMRGCPHDLLGCTGGERCSINSPNSRIAARAYNADAYGPDFVCAKRVAARKTSPTDGAAVNSPKVRTPNQERT